MYLDQYSAQGRNNNFNLLRLLAATAVLVSHCFALTTGDTSREPLRWLGTTPGTIAVDIFFVTSGFLVTGSLLKKQDILEFIRARFLRIYPAVFVMIALVLGLGTVLTTTPFEAYFSSPVTTKFIWHNATLIFGAGYYLPGVFTDNPYRNEVNGSLWTLPFELKMYASLVAIWMGSVIVAKNRERMFRRVAILTLTVSAVQYGLHLTGHRSLVSGDTSHLAYMFFSGAALYVFRSRISLAPKFFWPLIIVVVLSASSRTAFSLVYPIAVPYIVLFLAYVPKFLRSYNRLGDYSYGMYIYAFPVQQAMAATIPGLSIPGMIAGSLVITVLLAIASWHLIEKRALRLKIGAVPGALQHSA